MSMSVCIVKNHHLDHSVIGVKYLYVVIRKGDIHPL